MISKLIFFWIFITLIPENNSEDNMNTTLIEIRDEFNYKIKSLHDALVIEIANLTKTLELKNDLLKQFLNDKEEVRVMKEENKKTEEEIKIMKQENKETKEEIKVMKEEYNKEIKETKESLTKTESELKETKDQLKATRVVLSFNNKVSHYYLFTDINGKNKTFIIPLDGMKLQTFDEAVNLCKNFNSTLIEIESKEKKLILESFLSRLGHEFLSTQFGFFWIMGLRDSSGVWKYFMGTPFTFTNWAINEQITDSSYNNIAVQTYDGKWFNRPKTYHSYVMCEHNLGFS